jgi:hypothetical protein
VQLDAGFFSRLKREFAQSIQRIAEEFQALHFGDTRLYQSLYKAGKNRFRIREER